MTVMLPRLPIYQGQRGQVESTKDHSILQWGHKMKKIIAYIIVLLLIPCSSWAVNTPVDCSSAANVTAAFAAATSGDTLTCTVGGTWTGSVSISGKNINLVGGGYTINRSGVAFSVNSSGSKTIDISGFTLNATNSGENQFGIISTTGDRTGHIYIHGNQFYSLTTSVIYLTNAAGTVVYSNNFGDITTRIGEEPIYFDSDGGSAATASLTSMKLAVGFGQDPSSTIDWPTVEGNHFYCPHTGLSDVMDGGSAGKLRFRYNTMVDCYIYTHDICENAPPTTWGTYALESYNNKWIITQGAKLSGTDNKYAWQWFGGQTARIHDQRLELWGTGNYQTYFQWQKTRTGSAQSCGSGKQYLSNVVIGRRVLNCSASSDSYHDYSCYNCASSGSCTAPGTNPNDWCNNVPSGNGNKGTCTKYWCSNEWKTCTTAGDCSGGGTCDRALDDSYFNLGLGRPAGIFGAGQFVNATNAYVASEPMYIWNNKKYACDVSGNNCSFVSDVSSFSGATSSYAVLGVDLFTTAPSPNPLATCPAVGAGTCNANAYGVDGYGLTPPTYYSISVTQPLRGSISPVSYVEASGNTISPVYTPTTCFALTAWGGTCGCSGSSNTCTPFTASADCTITATITQTCGAKISNY
jgi:hypothetical protein